jgi:anti-sigma B factor antagonist
MALEVTVTAGDFQSYRIKLTGSLDTETVRDFNKAIDGVLADQSVRCLRIDLEDLKFISSLGLGSLNRARKAIESRGGLLVTIGAQPQILKVFEMVKMLPNEVVFANREEADEYLALIQIRTIDEKAARPK